MSSAQNHQVACAQAARVSRLKEAHRASISPPTPGYAGVVARINLSFNNAQACIFGYTVGCIVLNPGISYSQIHVGYVEEKMEEGS
jgi:hypothetical protein